jgi:hypothetical protein
MCQVAEKASCEDQRESPPVLYLSSITLAKGGLVFVAFSFVSASHTTVAARVSLRRRGVCRFATKSLWHGKLDAPSMTVACMQPRLDSHVPIQCPL